MGGEDVLGREFGGAGGVPDLRDLVADDFAHEALRRGRLAFGGDREGAAGSAVRDDPGRGPDAEEFERRLAAGGAVRLEGAAEPDALPVADEGQAGERSADAGGALQDSPFASVRRDAAAEDPVVTSRVARREHPDEEEDPGEEQDASRDGLPDAAAVPREVLDRRDEEPGRKRGDEAEENDRNGKDEENEPSEEVDFDEHRHRHERADEPEDAERDATPAAAAVRQVDPARHEAVQRHAEDRGEDADDDGDSDEIGHFREGRSAAGGGKAAPARSGRG